MLFSPSTPFILHIIIETLAGLSFTLAPHVQLQLPPTSFPSPATPAVLLTQSYGGTLLSTVLVALVFAVRPQGLDETARLVAAAFAFAHVWPCRRALTRMVGGEQAAGGLFGGPVVHLGVHGLMVGLFVYVAVMEA